MHIPQKKKWQLPESEVTPEAVFINRRKVIKAMGFGLASLSFASSNLLGTSAGFPSTLNPAHDGSGLKPTDYDLITGYNNFYEFTTSKEGVKPLANRGWKTEPWTLEVGGLVQKPFKIQVNDLVGKIKKIEQRIYRFRCVEAWSMVIPWDGFPLRKLIEMAEPTAAAKYIKFTSFYDPEAAPGQRGGYIDWPYVEGLTLAEAANDLAFLATGIYGKPMPNQNGAPIRLVVPWKYGFKSIKSIVKIEFVEKEPLNTWQQMAPHEYGFYANVNPNVSHPRWSQATERVIGGGLFGGRQDTRMFNGYSEEVAYLYKNMDLKKFY